MYPNLKLQIFKLGIHQNRIARELGIDESVLSKIIHGYREPSTSQRELISGYLKVEQDWLFEKFEGAASSRQPMNGSTRLEGEEGFS
jgi:transcriptional regulator with XRE-family HTH domain